MNDPGQLPPRYWEDIAGNRKLKNYFRSAAILLRGGKFNEIPRAFISGGRREGKTSGTLFGLRVLVCQNLDMKSFNPCGKCHYCREPFSGGWKNSGGLFRLTSDLCTSDKVGAVYVEAINGPSLSPADANAMLRRLDNEYGSRQVIWIDEIARLPLPTIQMLLSEMDTRSTLWLASSTLQSRVCTAGNRAADKEAFQALRDRFSIKISTQLPSREEFRLFLRTAARRRGVEVEGDKVCDDVYKATSGVPGQALLFVDSSRMLNLCKLTRGFVADQLNEDEGLV
jgi:hypothetical protein